MYEQVGQDPDEVEQLAVELGAASSLLDALRHDLTVLLAGTSWSGPDRDRFESDWSGPGSALVVRASGALSDASQAASASAHRQRLASAAA